MHHFSWYSFLGTPDQLVHVAGFAFSSIVFFLFLFAMRKYFVGGNKVVPPAKFSIVSLVDYMLSGMFKLTSDALGTEEDARTYFPLIATLFFLIFITNVLGLFPGMVPASDNLNTTLAMGVFVFIYYNIVGVQRQGLVNYIKHFMGPMLALAPLMIVVELISHAVRPIALGLRLRGNMYGDHLVLGIFSDLTPYVIPVIFLGLGLFVCFIQAFVFALLSIVYIAMASHHEDHGEEHAH